MNRIQSAVGLILFLAMCLGTELVGGLLTSPSIRSGWYSSLVKPFFSPPAWVFGPVWTLLFLLMALSAWMVWLKQTEHPVRIPLILFCVQLVFNVLWSALFFGARRPGWALAEIFVLWILILATVILFARVSRPAAALLIPYAAWVLFAMVLNGVLWWLNRGLPLPDGGVVS